MNSTSVVLVNTSSEGIPANNNNVGTGACLSDNGGLVAFTSSASNLVTGVSGNQNLYVKNTISGVIQVASSAYEGTFGDGNSHAQIRCFSSNGSRQKNWEPFFKIRTCLWRLLFSKRY